MIVFRYNLCYPAVCAFLLFQPVSAQTPQPTAEQRLSNIYNIIGEYATGCPESRLLIDLPSGPLTFRKQTDGGRSVLIVSGGINAGDSQRLDSYLNSDNTISELWLHSGGGNAAEGPRIGRVIRRRRLATRVPRGFQCISSCSIAFLGGIVRNVDDGAVYGVHTFYNPGLYEDFRTRFDGYSQYIGRLNPTALAAFRNARSPQHASVVATLSELRERDIRTFIHQQERRNALLAVDWAIYMSEMGVSRTFLQDVVFDQASLLYRDSSDAEQIRVIIRAAVQQRVTQGTPENLAISEALSEFASRNMEFARQFRTFMCPTRQQMARYNVVNIAN